MRDSSPDAQSSDSWLAAIFDLLVSTTFLVVIGILFVAFTVLLGKHELLILAYVLLGAAFLRSLVSAERRKKLEKVAIIGEGLKIFNRLEAHYLSHAPHSMLYYLFFPVTGIWSFFFSKEKGRQELKAYWGLLQWIIVLLFIGGFASYYRFYRYFDWRTAVAWLYMELLAIYFLCNFFAVPLSTTSIRLSLKKRRIRLFVITFLSLICLTSFTYVFMYRTDYEQLIPINLMLDQRLAKLKRRVQRNQKLPPHKAVLQVDEHQPYFERIFRSTQMFLRHQGPRILQFNQQYLFTKKQSMRELFFWRLNQAYQRHLSPLAVLGEHKHIYMTVTQEPKQFWGLIAIPFRESIFYIFHYQPGKLTMYRALSDMPVKEKGRIFQRWDQNEFVFSRDKRMAQLVVEFMRDKFKRASETLKDLTKPKPKQANQQSKAADRIAPQKEGSRLESTKRQYRRRARNQRQPTPSFDAPPSKGARSPDSFAPSSPPSPPASRQRIPMRRTAPSPPPQPPLKKSGRAGKSARRRRARRRYKPGFRYKPGKKSTIPRRKLPELTPRLGGTGSRGEKRAPALLQAKRQAERGARQLRIRWEQLEQLLRDMFGLPLPPASSTPFADERVRPFFPEPWKRHQVISPLWTGFVSTGDGLREIQRKLQQIARDAANPRRRIDPRFLSPNGNKRLQTILKLQLKLKRLQTEYTQTRSAYIWSQIVRLKKEINIEKLRTGRFLTRQPRRAFPSSYTPVQRYQTLIQQMKKNVVALEHLRIGLLRAWRDQQPKARRFSVHSKALVHFDYPRALGAKLLYDHFGDTPELVQTWWTRFYEGFLSFIMLLFQLTMPIHILLIIYCQLRLSDEGLGMEKLKEISKKLQQAED